MSAVTAALTASRWGRFTMFGLIGLSGFIPNLCALAVLVSVLGVNYAVATVVATQVAIAWNFLLLETLTYRHAEPGRRWRRAAKFAALNNADLLARIPMLVVLVQYAHTQYLVATVVTLVAMFVVRFLVTDQLIYRIQRPRRRIVPVRFRTPAPVPVSFAAEEV